MLTLREALARTSAQLSDAGIASAALDARLLIQQVMQVSHEWVVANDATELSATHIAQLQALAARRATHEPMAHLLGTRAFWKQPFMVSPDTLIPRPDSETVIEALLKYRPDTNAPLNILELGLGTGCLLFSALGEYPNARGVGVDISEAALQIAMKNCQALSLNNRVKFFHGSWCEPLPEAMRFDVVISNPPYIPSANIAQLAREVKDFEPTLALDGGDDGLKAYRALLECLPKHLEPASVVVLEVGDGQARDISTLAETQGFTHIGNMHDLGAIARVVVLSFP